MQPLLPKATFPVRFHEMPAEQTETWRRREEGKEESMEGNKFQWVKVYKSQETREDETKKEQLNVMMQARVE